MLFGVNDKVSFVYNGKRRKGTVHDCWRAYGKDDATGDASIVERVTLEHDGTDETRHVGYKTYKVEKMSSPAMV